MRIGTICGIVLLINPFFLLMLLIFVGCGLAPQMLGAFLLVIWHETAHIVTALFYGLKVSEIELLPFGGVARIDDLLQLDPATEAVVAVAGPISNIVLLLIIWVAAHFVTIDQNWYAFLVQANIAMAAVNVLPALPLDGGRVLRSRLVEKYGFRIATDRAAVIGQVFAFGLVVLGLIGVIIYGRLSAAIFSVLGCFVYAAAQKEKNTAVYVLLRYLTRKRLEIRARGVMRLREFAVTLETSIGEVVRHFSPTHYHLVWILDKDGNVVGFITEIELIDSLLRKGIHGKLKELVKHKI